MFVSAEPDDHPVVTESGGTVAVAVSIVIFIVLIAVLFGVIVRKRAHGKTWFPEGFCAFSRAGVFDNQRPRYSHSLLLHITYYLLPSLDKCSSIDP